MPATKKPKLPPARVVRAAEGVRAGLQRLTQLMAPPPFALLELAQGSMTTQAIYVAAELRIADALVDGPLSAQEIAQRVDAHPESVYRLLRLLASQSIFSEGKDGRFRQTPMSKALVADSPGSMRDIALLMGHPIHWEDWAHLVDSVRTGEASLPKLRGMGAFEFIDSNPEYGSVFTSGMGNMSDTETLPIVAGYDFSGYRQIVDVCGGRGALLAEVLKHSPNARGVLFDARAEENGAKDVLAEAGVSDRTSIEVGGLFDPVPEGGDAYILKHVVHDWPEDQALQILKNVRKAIPAHGRILLVEFVVPSEGNGRHPAKLVDLWLMLLVGGKERTSEQYSSLLASAGFQLERVVQTAAPVSVIEARPI
ncbi:methyltransferase [Streptomyces sp. NPDC006879]|uniref:methyltransferase n=1 Tax=Streptomyces sp. NPDC006879 TaxID=3364767 RepID=UPI0036818E07